MKKILFIPIALFLISCSTQKMLITNFEDVDLKTPIYYYDNLSKITFNGYEVYNVSQMRMFESLDTMSTIIENSKTSRDLISNYPFGKSDYSWALLPSLSESKNYIVTTNEDFSLMEVSFTRNIDVDIIDLSNGDVINTLETEIPQLEFYGDKYIIPWAKDEDAFYSLKNDSLSKVYVDGKSTLLFELDNIHRFSISPSEKFAVIVSGDTVYFYDIESNIKSVIEEVDRPKGIRSIAWNEDNNSLSFGEGWRVWLYNYKQAKLDIIKMQNKVFFVDWLNNDEIIYVIGSHPPDALSVKIFQFSKIKKYSLKEEKKKTIYTKSNHSPLFTKPQVSLSGKLILFSELGMDGKYFIKLITLDGSAERELGHGALPYWKM